MCKITPRNITETDGMLRSLKQIITDVQDADHVSYKKYELCRPRLYQAYLKADAQLNGIKMLLIDQRKAVDDIRRNRRRQLIALQNTVDEWNQKHPVGTLVKTSNSLGVVTQAPTSAPAMLLMKSTPVIWLKGIHNYIALSRVEVI